MTCGAPLEIKLLFPSGSKHFGNKNPTMCSNNYWLLSQMNLLSLYDEKRQVIQRANIKVMEHIWITENKGKC